MLRRTNIGWADYSGGDLNVVIRGRSCPTSEGCAHCYVERWYQRYRKGRMPEHTSTYPKKLARLSLASILAKPGDTPYRRGPGSRPIFFVADFGDLFCEDVPRSFIFDTLSTIYPQSEADWVLLTKRPERMLEEVNLWLNSFFFDSLPPHIWCLVTAENQRRADERIPVLLQVKAQVLGVSVEPMLGPIDMYDWLSPVSSHESHGILVGDSLIDWVIVGAESGADRRPFNKSWAITLCQRCKDAEVPFFYKQSSGLHPGTDPYLFGQRVQEFPR